MIKNFSRNILIFNLINTFIRNQFENIHSFIFYCGPVFSTEGNAQTILTPPPPGADTSLDAVTHHNVEAAFPDSWGSFGRFLGKNLDAGVADKNHAKPGRYTIIIRFIVGKDGAISDIQPQTNFGFGMEEEAVRVIKLSPSWKRATMDGIPVKAYRIQPITFVVN